MDQTQLLSPAGSSTADNYSALARAKLSECHPSSQISDERPLAAVVDTPAAAWTPSFSIDPTILGPCSAGAGCWSHELYRGQQRQPVQVFYSCTKDRSEEIANMFLNEKVLGFDTEWVPRIADDQPTPLQYRISMIQIACEDKIALFHIGRHFGSSPDELIAPSLRRIIECGNITKAGVNIMGADCSRLRKWFNLVPRSIFELCHLHNLVTYGGTDPARCTKKSRKLEELVITHLGLKLAKGDVRMTFATSPLSSEQQKYAAADAYAGFMLYHCMNAKRALINPQPAMPIYADACVKGEPLRLRAANGGDESVTAIEFFMPSTTSKSAGVNGAVSADKIEPTEYKKRKSRAHITRNTIKTTSPERRFSDSILDMETSNRLFDLLSAHRKSEVARRGSYSFAIASDTVLREMSQKAPINEEDLLEIRGIGPRKAAVYGSAWLSIVRRFIRELPQTDSLRLMLETLEPADVSPLENRDHTDENRSGTELEVAEPHENRRTPMDKAQPAATLHTSLSFSIEHVKIFDNSTNNHESTSHS